MASVMGPPGALYLLLVRESQLLSTAASNLLAAVLGTAFIRAQDLVNSVQELNVQGRNGCA